MNEKKLEAGEGLDRAVALAIGWKYTEKQVIRNRFDVIAGTNLQGWWDGDRYVSHETPKFSTDLSTAFAGAEQVGLWNDYAYCRASGQHVLSKTVPVASWGDTIAHADTAALAICRAILKLNEPGESRGPFGEQAGFTVED